MRWFPRPSCGGLRRTGQSMWKVEIFRRQAAASAICELVKVQCICNVETGVFSATSPAGGWHGFNCNLRAWNFWAAGLVRRWQGQKSPKALTATFTKKTNLVWARFEQNNCMSRHSSTWSNTSRNNSFISLSHPGTLTKQVDYIILVVQDSQVGCNIGSKRMSLLDPVHHCPNISYRMHEGLGTSHKTGKKTPQFFHQIAGYQGCAQLTLDIWHQFRHGMQARGWLAAPFIAVLVTMEWHTTSPTWTMDPW